MPSKTFNPQQLAWRITSFSSNGNCVEVAPVDGMVAMRNSQDRSGTVLLYTASEWRAFLLGAKAGEFDDLV